MIGQEERLELELEIFKLEKGYDDLTKLLRDRKASHDLFLNRLTILLELPQQANEDDVLQELEKLVKHLKRQLTLAETCELLGVEEVRPAPAFPPPLNFLLRPVKKGGW